MCDLKHSLCRLSGHCHLKTDWFVGTCLQLIAGLALCMCFHLQIYRCGPLVHTCVYYIGFPSCVLKMSEYPRLPPLGFLTAFCRILFADKSLTIFALPRLGIIPNTGVLSFANLTLLPVLSLQSSFPTSQSRLVTTPPACSQIDTLHLLYCSAFYKQYHTTILILYTACSFVLSTQTT